MIFEFQYEMNGMQCDMAVTSVTGHLMETDFPPRIQEMELLRSICALRFELPSPQVCSPSTNCNACCLCVCVRFVDVVLVACRTQRTSSLPLGKRHDGPIGSFFGWIAIVRGRTSPLR